MMRSAPSPSTLGLMGAVLFLWAAGCDGDGGPTEPEGSSTVSLDFTGLAPLPGALNYQAWLVVGTPADFWGYPLLLFDVDEEGRMVDPGADTLVGGPLQAGVNLESILGVAVSLETTDTLLDYSSYTFVLGGDVAQGSAHLSTTHWIAFGEALTAPGGSFVLTTPTSETQEDELSGIWFMDVGSEPAVQGLQLPEAPVGWNYEAWVALGQDTLSTGKFLDPAEPDSAALYGGALSPPGFPGEDFLSGAPSGLTFPTDLSGASVFITMEPWAEWDTEPNAPFFLTLLEGLAPPDAIPGTSYTLSAPANQLPTGTAEIQGS